jgi:hypothetical protein
MKLKIRLFYTILVFCSVAGLISTMILPGQERNIRFLLVVCDGIMLGLALLALWRNRNYYGVWAFVIFILGSTTTYLYTSDRFAILEHLNGMRDSLFFFGSLVVVYDIYHSEYQADFIHWFSRFLLFFAVAQLPVAIVQFIRFGAGDGVGGTYGTAGGSGYLSQLLFLICFYLAVRYASLEDGSHFSLKRLPWILVLLIPCAINETKISFVLLAAFIALIAGSRRRIIRLLPMLLLGAVLVYMLNYVYVRTEEEQEDIFDPQYIEQYLLTNTAEAGADLPRFQRLVIMFRMMGNDTGSLLFGMGYGVVGGGNILGVSRLGRALYYLMQGSRILLFRTWIQGGLLNVLTMLFAVFGWVRVRTYQYPTLRKFYWFLIFALLVSWSYDEGLLDRVFAPVVAYFMMWITDGGKSEEDAEHAGQDAHEEEQADAA